MASVRARRRLHPAADLVRAGDEQLSLQYAIHLPVNVLPRALVHFPDTSTTTRYQGRSTTQFVLFINIIKAIVKPVNGLVPAYRLLELLSIDVPEVGVLPVREILKSVDVFNIPCFPDAGLCHLVLLLVFSLQVPS